jgi:hypothetical protein
MQHEPRFTKTSRQLDYVISTDEKPWPPQEDLEMSEDASSSWFGDADPQEDQGG